jgi:arginine utilization protein RocB
MVNKTLQTLDNVRTPEEAQVVIASLLKRFSSETAYERLIDEARFAHQTVDEVARRTASNLLTSYVTRKPDGIVNF